MEPKNANSVAQALSVLVQASTLSSADANRLTPLTSDTKSEETDGEDSLGAPAGSVYEGHSGEIVDTPNDVLDKAEAQLDDARVDQVVIYDQNSLCISSKTIQND